MLDVQFVRSQFPALSDGWAYFDNAGGSQVLKSVAERISDYLLTTSVQTGASYEPSLRASARLAEARAKMATVHRCKPARGNRIRTFNNSPNSLPGDCYGRPTEPG